MCNEDRGRKAATGKNRERSSFVDKPSESARKFVHFCKDLGYLFYRWEMGVCKIYEILGFDASVLKSFIIHITLYMTGSMIASIHKVVKLCDLCWPISYRQLTAFGYFKKVIINAEYFTAMIISKSSAFTTTNVYSLNFFSETEALLKVLPLHCMRFNCFMVSEEIPF